MIVDFGSHQSLSLLCAFVMADVASCASSNYDAYNGDLAALGSAGPNGTLDSVIDTVSSPDDPGQAFLMAYFSMLVFF